jgi:WhiB family transcriptional regulator, redox-sensing transcriptional regulator
VAGYGGVSIGLRGRRSGGRVFTEWHKRAACKGETDLFFSYDEEMVEQARAICENCPVRRECLETALADSNLYGVWGGFTKAERRRLRRKEVA